MFLLSTITTWRPVEFSLGTISGVEVGVPVAPAPHPRALHHLGNSIYYNENTRTMSCVFNCLSIFLSLPPYTQKQQSETRQALLLPYRLLLLLLPRLGWVMVPPSLSSLLFFHLPGITAASSALEAQVEVAHDLNWPAVDDGRPFLTRKPLSKNDII